MDAVELAFLIKGSSLYLLDLLRPLKYRFLNVRSLKKHSSSSNKSSLKRKIHEEQNGENSGTVREEPGTGRMNKFKSLFVCT